jgi:hypothetical protein
MKGTVTGDPETTAYSPRAAMYDRQNPYFRAAMRNELLEVQCRESASWIERLFEDAETEVVTPDSSESTLSSQERQELRHIMLEYARAQRDEAEKHARMRKTMEPFL